MKRCYYEVLEVDRKATPAEIKTNYRKMALKYHPDKNQEDGAKERFVEINEAYNVLSDPNERTWYDNNREKLLFNKEDMTKEDLDQFTFGFNIWHYFTTGCFKGYEDGQGGFYAVYRDVFEKIKAQEAKAYSLRDDVEEDQRKYEGFGDSTTSEQRVLQFYEDWENFSTYKTFVWSEEWDTREAGSRWVRREMQKENKKQRQGERKTYVKTIKDLLSYVRKRDPRFIAYVNRLKEEEEKKAQQKLEREKEKKKEKEEMKVVKQRLEEERFREIEQYYKKQNEMNSVPNHVIHRHNGKQEVEHESEFYCQICEKEFKSENQLRNHEKSKQHKQMVRDIEKEVLLKEQIMQKANKQEEQEETKEPQPNNTKEEEPSPTKKKKNKKKKNQQQKQQDQQPQEKVEPKQEVKQETKKVEPKQEKKVESSSEDEDHFMNTLLNNRNKKNEAKPNPAQQPQPAPKADKKKQPVKVEDDVVSEEEEREEAKLGKAKLKKQKKAEQAEKNGGKANQLKCKVCNEAFSSKTKLFEHINKTGHATAK